MPSGGGAALAAGAGGRSAGGGGGFSLVEVVVTLAVLGILLAVAVPSTVMIMPRVRLQSNASTLAGEIALARGSAIAKGARYKIVFTPHGVSAPAVPDSYTLWRRSVAECPGPGNWCVVASSRLSGIEIVGVSNFSGAEANTLVLEWDGTANVFAGERGRITLQTPPRPPKTVGEHLRRIVIEPTGRMSVEKSTDGVAWVGA